ncbi:hypothetical protein COT75_02760 [Candidatus Beckwithbacteria bacterium CG10_big_fil_rev_8_21_14_0_10_34_10]|uniref:Peptidoglycan glycosyltransferase n=1 Tax=Candidatus Beckwithbacteria bacterium CG10_big_fil_rev_8_21_14_0_10_34_10 TaxID=1974495 RepID=A0A2H0W965_9BACT|nr:MAG: hypothetical protein COT75_02760 [Candidatus Beckwithbacteria bacterium CG10_big_fil_rev_8_21_14_0_10_34_10]
MKKPPFFWRLQSLKIIFILLFIAIISRLFYWQVLARESLANLAKNQYYSEKEIQSKRGEILASDNFPLASNKTAYLLFTSLREINKPVKEIALKLAPFTFFEEEASQEGKKKPLKKDLIKKEEENLLEKLQLDNLSWVILKHKILKEDKEKIEDLKLKGLGFEEEQIRYYPEASMAAHLLGFLGKNEAGQDTGYFGLEGYYDNELRGRQGLLTQETDAANKPILIGSFFSQEKKDGQNLVLHLNRSIQFMVEEKLEKAVEKYGAKSGSVMIMDPWTGGVIALANYPSFDPKKYYLFDKDKFINDLISDSYEPGSTFKIFVMAAALDKEVVKSNTKCDICDKPLKIDKYEIKTWDEKYHPDSTMDKVIQNSDNLGMVFVSRKLGLDDFFQYLTDFGFGSLTEIDLQGETEALLKDKSFWNNVDLATASFGQGLAVSGTQLLRATGAIANGGKLMKPQVVKEIISSGERIKIEPEVLREVIKPKTAKIITEMMVQAVEKGETKWLKIKGYQVAGKTGTAQIPVAGHYDTEKTIASFVGFAPAKEPKFVMLVKLREPSSSPWGSETAAPLFFSITKELLLYYGIPPS